MDLSELGSQCDHAMLEDDIQTIKPVRPDRDGTGRRGRKRAGQACALCRKRKVRCDIVLRGPPCSNCCHDQETCVVPLSRRQKRILNAVAQNYRSEVIEELSSPNTEEAFQLNAESHKSNATKEPGETDDSPTINIEPTATPEKEGRIPTENLNLEFHVNPPSRSTPVESYLMTSCWPKSSISYNFRHLPPTFTKISSSLDLVDYEYLLKHGAFTVPSNFLQIELLNSYERHIYPHLPFLDLEECFTSVGFRSSHAAPQTQRPQISLLLFQAILFAGSTVLGLEILREAGYSTRSELEEMLFRRVRLLYDFDTCSDNHSVLQALLLMTYIKLDTSDGKTRNHWLGLAISLAMSMGIHINSIAEPPYTRKHRLERRIWWCIFVLDRTMAVGLHSTIAQSPCQAELDQPPKGQYMAMIRKEDCKIPVLCLEDFENRSEVDVINGGEEFEACKLRFLERVMLSWSIQDAPRCIWPVSNTKYSDFSRKPNLFSVTQRTNSNWQDTNDFMEILTTPSLRGIGPESLDTLSEGPSVVGDEELPSSMMLEDDSEIESECMNEDLAIWKIGSVHAPNKNPKRIEALEHWSRSVQIWGEQIIDSWKFKDLE